jgi:hypothetical protein
LRLVPKHDGDLKTTVYSNRTGRGREREEDDTSESSLRQGSRTGFGVWRESEFAVEVEYIEERQTRQIP